MERPFVLERRLQALPDDVLILTPDDALLERLAAHAGGRLFGLALALDPPARHQRLLDLGARLRLPVVAAHDVFFLSPDDYPVYRTLRAIDACSTVDFLPEEDAGHPATYWTSRARPSPNRSALRRATSTTT